MLTQKKGALGLDYVDDAVAYLSRIGRRLLVVLFLFSFVALVYYVLKGYVPEFHSDSAAKNLLAEEVVRQRSYFPSDWNYVNGDLWVLFGQVFIIPFVPFFKNGYALHAVSGLISSLFILASLWCVSGMIVRSRWMRLLAVTIFAGGVSWVMAENLFGQVSYGNVFCVAAFTLYFGWRWLQSETKRGVIGWGVGLSLLSVLTFWSNPQRALAYDLAPMLMAVIAWATTSKALFIWSAGARRWSLTSDSKRFIGLLVLLFVSATIGTVAHSVTLDHVNNAAGAGSANWLTFENIQRNLWLTLEGVLGSFAALPTPARPVMSLGGVYEAARLLGILAMLVMVPVAISASLRDARASARMLGAFAASGICLFIFLQVTSTTPDMSSPVVSARYMLPSLILGVVLLVGYAEERGIRTVGGIVAWMALFVLLTSLISPQNSFTRLYRGTPISAHQQALDALREQGLQYGYASYWNSGVTTVLSGGDVKVRQIELLQGIPVPRMHLASSSWYKPETWDGNSFLMLNEQELAELDLETTFSFTGRPLRRVVVGNFVILVFKENIAKNLPGWGVQAGALQNVAGPFSVATRHQIGRLSNNQGRLRLTSEQGEEGFLHFGPYVELPAGEYIVEAEIASPDEGELGYLDVVSEQGAHIYGNVKIVNGVSSGHLSLRFKSSEDIKDLEVRVYSNGVGALELNSISISPSEAVRVNR